MAGVTFDGITKTYPDGTTAVNSLSLEIDDGEFMVLVGPSGCGKTTALRMVAGLEDISRGRLLIGDRVVNHVPSRDRDIAMVFQSYALYPHLTVYDNIAFGLKIKKVPKAEIDRRVQRAADVLGLEPYLKTTLYVTHDQVEAMTMGHRVAVMRKGELQQVADPQTLYDRPVNLFVGGFIGSPSMNMLEATLERSNGAITAVAGSQRVHLDAETLNARPALKDYEGKRVILGIRPEDIEDVALVSDAPVDKRLKGIVELREALGSEIMVHFRVDARPAETEDTKELAEDVHGDAAAAPPPPESGEAIIVGRFGARSRVKEGEPTEAAVDTRALHFFDPDTGLGVYDGKGAG